MSDTRTRPSVKPQVLGVHVPIGNLDTAILLARAGQHDDVFKMLVAMRQGPRLLLNKGGVR